MNRLKTVPDTDATVTVVRLLAALAPAACRQTTVVPLAHEVVPQSASAIDTVGVPSTVAKLSPLIVADAPPLFGQLPWPTIVQETTGAIVAFVQRCL